jgi:hypothetical protein
MTTGIQRRADPHCEVPALGRGRHLSLPRPAGPGDARGESTSSAGRRSRAWSRTPEKELMA